jgi:hypothetical protein
VSHRWEFVVGFDVGAVDPWNGPDSVDEAGSFGGVVDRDLKECRKRAVRLVCVRGSRRRIELREHGMLPTRRSF